jgi:DUF4097 and DUF4098 domain-containing protein YvlB
MNIRKYVKKSIDNQKKLFLILLAVTVISGILAFTVQITFGGSSVYRDELFVSIETGFKQTINIYTAGMPVTISLWNGDDVRIRCVAELPLIIQQTENEITISQDDGFAVSMFTLDMFRYAMEIELPRALEYRRLNITTAGGNVFLNSHHLVAELVTVESKNASINVTRAACDYEIRTRSGDVYMDFDFVVSPVQIITDSGNVRIKIPDYDMGKAEEMFNIDTVSGTVTIIEKDSSLPENFPLL